MPDLRLGTRGSALALAQAGQVAAALAALGARVEIVRVRTEGDRNQHDSSTVLGVGVFVKELERAILDGRVDLAVHSAKDLPTAETPGLAVAAFLRRDDPRDALVSRDGRRLADLPAGARVATDSPRRAAFLRLARPDLVIAPIRGNVDTRLRRLDAGECEAIVLAAAGLRRLGLDGRAAEILEPEVMLPAAAQGAIAVQAAAVGPTLAALDHALTRQEVAAERAFLKTVGGGCRAPIATLARADRERVTVEGAVISPDGRRIVRDRIEGATSDAAALGAALAEELLARGAGAIYQESRA